MNALTRTATTTLPRVLTASKRMQSTTATTSAPFVMSDKMGKKIKTIWVSDQGAYPVMASLAFAMAFCTWYGFYNLFTSPDIRMSRDKRYSIVRTWGRGEW